MAGPRLDAGGKSNENSDRSIYQITIIPHVLLQACERFTSTLFSQIFTRWTSALRGFIGFTGQIKCGYDCNHPEPHNDVRSHDLRSII